MKQYDPLLDNCMTHPNIIGWVRVVSYSVWGKRKTVVWCRECYRKDLNKKG